MMPSTRDGAALLAGASLVVAAACAGSHDVSGAAGPWAGDVTTEDGLTTVYNESGSVWGGTAMLAEEMSIGLASGPEEQVFGNIASVHAHEGTIYVVDAQAPAVRAFDFEGNFLATLGTAGDGIGEYSDPYRLAVAPDGRVFVSEPESGRIHVYAADGTALDIWQARMPRIASSTLLVDDGGVLWAPVLAADEVAGRDRHGIQALPEGSPGERALIEELGGLPVAADELRNVTWTPAGAGTLVVGYANALVYQFEVQRLGRPVLAVERAWQPTPLDPDFAAWYLEVYRSQRPATYPAYVGFTSAASGEIWVTRPAPARRVDACEEDLSDLEAARANPCWRPAFLVDVFGQDGRFLGDIELPDGVTPVASRLHVDGDTVVAVSLAADGVPRVKRFRLILPAASR